MKKNKKKDAEPILYSVRMMKDSIRNRKLVCATIIERGTLDVDFIAHEIAKSTSVTVTDVVAVLAGFMEFSMEHLASGYRLNFGKLGQFFPSLKAHCVKTVEECDASTIEKVCCRFRPSKELNKILNRNSFDRTLPSAEERKTLKEQEAKYKEVLDRQEE